MKFEPHYFLAIAKRQNVSITISGSGKIKIKATNPKIFGLFVLAAKKHKRKLLKHLTTQAETCAPTQADLFGDSLH